MSTPITAAGIESSALPATARLERPWLVERIRAGLREGAVLIAADAGFGKTAALTEALRTHDTAAAWVTCSELSSDAAWLLTELAAAARRAVSAISRAAPPPALGPPRRVDPTGAVELLFADLEDLLVEPLVIVVDEAEHLRDSKAAIAILDSLLARRSSMVRVAVTTRGRMPLRTAKLQATGRLLEIGRAELAFSAAECASLLRERTGTDPGPEEVQAVMELTEGWPLGVALSACRTEGAAPDPSRAALAAFFDEEVLDRLSPLLRHAVVDSSVVRELSPTVASALGISVSLMGEIESGGLFLRPAGDQGWSRYHPLFRDHLLERLGQRPPEDVKRLHVRAASALDEVRRPAEAIDHWLAAGEWQSAVKRLTGEAGAVVAGDPEVAATWMGRLPAAARRDPSVRLIEGQLEWAAGRGQRAMAILREAMIELRDAGDRPSEWIARHRLADALYSAGEFEELGELAEGMEAAPAVARGSAAATLMLAAMGLAARGLAEDSEAVASRALAMSDVPVTRHLDALRLVHLDIPAGRVDAAVARLRASLGELEGSDPLNRLTHGRAALAQALSAIGDDAAALEQWRLAIEEAGRGGPSPYPPALGRVQCALIYARARRVAEAQLELLRAGDVTAAGWRGSAAHVVHATLALARGAPGEALAAVDRALQVADAGPLPDWAAVATDCAPILFEAGAGGRARELVQATLRALDQRLPGSAGSFFRARLLALLSWLRHEAGDSGAWEDLRQAWREAGPNVRHVLRRDWQRLGPLVWTALERQALWDPESVVRQITEAWPGGGELARFTSHPDAAVRHAALVPFAGSGHPAAPARLEELTGDPNEVVAAAAQAASVRIRLVPTPLLFRLLGRFEARRGAWLIDDAAWGRPMAARVVRFLLLHRDVVVPEDDLFEVFWPEKPEALARRSLQVAVSRARAVLKRAGDKQGVLRAAGGGYRLSLAEQDLVDVDEFEFALTAALGQSGEERRRLLGYADSLWCGDPLPEERYAVWTIEWRERLTQRYVSLLLALVEAHCEAGDVAATIEAARRLVEVDPLNEGGHRALMRAYWHAGRRGHALRQFLACRSALVDSLGIEPSEQTARLHARILAGEAVPA